MDPDEMSLAIAEASPEVPEVQFNLGVALANQGDLEGAIAADRRALALAPMDPETRLRSSISLTQTLVELAQRKVASGASRAAAVAGSRDDWEAALESARLARDSFPADPEVARFAEVVEAAALEARGAAPAP